MSQSDLEKIAENYETQCPIHILKATSLSVKCHSSLWAQLDLIDVKSSAIGIGERRLCVIAIVTNETSSLNAVRPRSYCTNRFCSC